MNNSENKNPKHHTRNFSQSVLTSNLLEYNHKYFQNNFTFFDLIPQKPPRVMFHFEPSAILSERLPEKTPTERKFDTENGNYIILYEIFDVLNTKCSFRVTSDDNAYKTGKEKRKILAITTL